MNFFKKKHTESTDATPVSEQTVQNITEAPEEQPLPRPGSTDFQLLVRQEVKRMRTAEQVLSAPHLARLEESLRLNETKMENIEDNLERTRKQQERVRRYQELSIEMREQKGHLFEINKMMAASSKERDDLRRFEEFENIQGCFQRLTVLDAIRREQKQRMSQLTHDVEDATHQLDDDTKRLQQLRDEMRQAEQRLSMGLDAVAEAQRVEGRQSYLSVIERRLTERMSALRSRQSAIEKEMDEHRVSMETLAAQMTTKRTRRQSIEVHQRMTEHSELLEERLTRLVEQQNTVASLEHQQKDSTRKQADENELLGRVYTDFLQVEQKIQALQDELSVHREQNHGLRSYQLQERAMRLKLRREMLIGASSLWVRIVGGYNLIEEHMQKINSMRLKLENLSDKVLALDKELAVLRRTCHDKEYTYTLSKSQNVIQLRSDLREGTSCTVCGATHHPYHSDTMLEQNKLIGEIKSDYDQLAGELRAKEQLLLEMRLEQADLSARKEITENELIMLRTLQNGYVADWQAFASLDPSFAQCDSSTNAPARTAMLRQLIENIGAEVDQAQKELDNYNFHQTRINELTEQIAKQEQRKGELTTRLNEVNTGCQVLAAKLERVSTQLQQANDDYTRQFEAIDRMMTIPDWKNIWKRSPEALIMRLQELTKEWNQLNDELREAQNQRTLQELTLEHGQQIHQILLANMQQVDDDLQNCHDMLEEGRKQLERLLDGDSSKTRLKQLLEDRDGARECFDRQDDVVKASERHMQEMAGRLTENADNGRLTDERTSTERQKLDIWMRQYNANHSPVQYAELEEVFGTDRNWNDMRERLRSMEVESLLTQSRVDKLRSQLVALQAEGSINDGDADMVQHQLATQIETLEQRRKEAMMLIANFTQQINAHHKAEAQIREEQMKE